jgi:hypothetical protein
MAGAHGEDMPLYLRAFEYCPVGVHAEIVESCCRPLSSRDTSDAVASVLRLAVVNISGASGIPFAHFGDRAAAPETRST